MKRIYLLLVLFLTVLLSVACGASSAQSDLKVYHAKRGGLVNPNFATYSFEYPSNWKIQEEANHIAFASDANLLKSPPEKLQSGEIIAGLSMNKNMSPEDMIDSYTTSHTNIQFDPMVSMIVNGHKAAYQSGTDSETGDQTLIVATDIGDNLRAFLTARLAAGELDQWKETFFRIAQSLQVEK